MLKDIRAVFFDFDNTLVDYVKSDIKALSILAEQLPVDLEKFIERAVHHIMTFHTLYGLGKVNPSEMHHYRLSNTVQDFGLNWDPKYLKVYLDSYLNTYYVYPGADSLLKKLYSTVYLGMVTNAISVDEQRERISCSGLGQYFNDILVCAEINHFKPDPRAFLYLVEKRGLDPSQCVFVGDTEKHDILGAEAAGLRSIRIVHTDKPVSSAADYLCHGFEELSHLLTVIL